MPITEGATTWPVDSAGVPGVGIYTGSVLDLWHGDGNGHGGVLLYDAGGNILLSSGNPGYVQFPSAQAVKLYDSAGNAYSKGAGGGLKVEVFNSAGTEVGVTTMADGTGTPHPLQVAPYPFLFNETSYDRQRGNTLVNLLASAARTTTTETAVQTNYNARGVIVMLDVTVAGTGHLNLSFRWRSTTNNNSPDTAATNVTTTGLWFAVCYPGAALEATYTNASVTLAIPYPLPRSWSVKVTPSDGSSWTYSLDASMVN